MQINTLNNYIKKRFGRKLYKISLDAGMTCPNRDGSLDTRGCIFCSAGGSGDFAASRKLSITVQIESAKKLVSHKIKNTSDEPCYIAYFQAYTNTYAPVEILRDKYMEAVRHKDIAAISIATRPDCIDENIMKLLIEINSIKPVFIELGLQTSNENTANYIRRGYPNSTFENCIKLIDSYNKKMSTENNKIHIIVHMIIGLPGETVEHMENTIRYINSFPIHGIKLQLLHVLKNTDLKKIFSKNEFKVLQMEEYTDILIRLLLFLRPDIVIHRLTGDGPKKLLIAPLWSSDKKRVLNYINKRISETQANQGDLYTWHRFTHSMQMKEMRNKNVSRTTDTIQADGIIYAK